MAELAAPGCWAFVFSSSLPALKALGVTMGKGFAYYFFSIDNYFYFLTFIGLHSFLAHTVVP